MRLTTTSTASRYKARGLAHGSMLPLARVRRGLELLRVWMAKCWDWWSCLSPGRIARDLGLGHGDAVNIGYALRFWERLGYVKKERNNPACYYAADRLVMTLHYYGCLEQDEENSDTACGLIGTLECPFLVGYGGDGA